MNEARRYLVCGLVQGVGFRYFVLRTALARGVVGFVRNMPDGRVEVLAEGSADALDGLGRDLEVGSKFSRVSKVEEVGESPTGRYLTFSIRD